MQKTGQGQAGVSNPDRWGKGTARQVQGQGGQKMSTPGKLEDRNKRETGTEGNRW
jgi:hypothetical protein